MTDRLTMTPETFRIAEQAALIRGAARMQEAAIRAAEMAWTEGGWRDDCLAALRALRADEVAITAPQP